MQIFTNPNYNFLRWRYHALAVSLVIIIAGLASMLTRGLRMGIDFAGGASVILRFRDEVPMNQLRGVLRDATIQQYGKANEHSVLIRLPRLEREGDYAGGIVSNLHRTLNPDLPAGKHDINYHGRDALAAILKQADPDKKGTNAAASDYYDAVAKNIIDQRSKLGIFSSMDQVRSAPGVTTGIAGALNSQTHLGRINVLSQETVGPQVGRELQKKAMLAIVLSVLAMGLYIAIRFDLKFGVAAVLCLVHDVLITLTFLAFMPGAEFEILTVAALLMVVGYSINDKVVIYDRVRENLRKAGGRTGDFEKILNDSLNQSLSRTILTGGCVMLTLIALIIFGGPVINEFAWLLLVGTIAGTYSTLTIAPAIVIAWNNARGSSPPAARVREITPREENNRPAQRKRKAG